MATAVVANGGADVFGNRADSSEQVLETLVQELGMLVQRVVEVGDVGLVMLAVVNLHRLRVDVRL